MTISVTSSQATFLGNGLTSTFNFGFVCDDPTTFQAFFNAADGTITLLNPAQYTLFLNPPATDSLHHVGGNIVYPTAGPPIPNGTSLTVRRTVPLAQLDSISNQGDFSPIVVELALDTQCLETQQVSARTGQIRGTWQTGIQYNFGDIVQDGVNGANTLNYYMAANANLSGVWATDLAAGDWSLGINVAAISGFAAAAAASAATATAEAGVATTQAGIATTQAGVATAAATTATTQAGIATAAAATATTEAGIATTQAGIATTQAGIATTQAGIATTQAGIATTEAGVATAEAAAAAASAVLAASTLTSTSVTSNTIGTGAFTFTTQTNKQYQAGQFIVVSNGSNFFTGTVTSYNPGTGVLVIDSTSFGGAGAFASWNISVAGEPGTGIAPAVINGGTP